VLSDVLYFALLLSVLVAAPLAAAYADREPDNGVVHEDQGPEPEQDRLAAIRLAA
jgi:hypothetical protein